MTFADHAFGYHFWTEAGGGWAVTVSQQTQFLAPVRSGELVEVEPVTTRRTQSLIFVRGDFLAAGAPVMTVSAVWKIAR
jgi:acyl-coenzyme A thioesterase PaaI-like protein